MNDHIEFSLVSLRDGILVVHYPEGFEGTDYSVGYLWFNADDFASENNPVQFPGDRQFFDTEEEARADARAYTEFHG